MVIAPVSRLDELVKEAVDLLVQKYHDTLQFFDSPWLKCPATAAYFLGKDVDPKAKAAAVYAAHTGLERTLKASEALYLIGPENQNVWTRMEQERMWIDVAKEGYLPLDLYGITNGIRDPETRIGTMNALTERLTGLSGVSQQIITFYTPDGPLPCVKASVYGAVTTQLRKVIKTGGFEDVAPIRITDVLAAVRSTLEHAK